MLILMSLSYEAKGSDSHCAQTITALAVYLPSIGFYESKIKPAGRYAVRGGGAVFPGELPLMELKLSQF